MKLVLDASAAYDVLEENTYARRIDGAKELLAPDLIVAELLNARWKVTRTKAVAPSLDRVLGLLERLRLEPTIRYAVQAASLAEQLDHPVYDCAYVALAQRESAKPLTFDQRLVKKLSAAGLESLLR